MHLAPSTEALVKNLLCNTGRIAQHETVTIELMEGNPNRRDYTTRRRFLVRTNDDTIAVLVVGKDLLAVRQKTDLFAKTYPDLACPIFAQDSAENGEILLTEYFVGFTASDALNLPQIGEKGVLAAIERLAERLKKEVKASSTDTIAKEIAVLQSNVLAIPYWTPGDRSFLENTVLPLSNKILRSQPATHRVSNGDLVLSNILLNTLGEVRIIDYEQASSTYFYDEDWLRLTYWKTPGAIRAFALSQIANQDIIQLYLWLKQLVFEAEVMLPDKADANLRYWGRLICRHLERSQSEFQRSLLWPYEPICEQAKLLQLHSDAHYNYNRGLDFYEFTEQKLQQVRNAALQLQDEVMRQRNLVALRDYKITRMQSSFSWKATAWLRALRRKYLDPHRPKSKAQIAPPSASFPEIDTTIPFSKSDFKQSPQGPIWYNIDTPKVWSTESERFFVFGCVFTELPIKLKDIRARIGDRIYSGIYGLDRAEIPEKFLPQTYSAFELEIILNPSDIEIVLEVSDEQETWYPFFTKSLITLHTPKAAIPCRDYSTWVRSCDTLTAAQVESLKQKASKIPSRPLISVVMPVYNTPDKFLSRAIESVLTQVYSNWELCIADDASTEPHVRALIENYAKQDSRIKTIFRSKNGHISIATNSALEIATGEYTTFLDHDDELAPHALYYVAKLISECPTVEIVYSDEDKIDEGGQRFTPHFKPDWNPDLLASQNYFCHLTAYKTATLRAVGGLRAEFEGSQDWDLALRTSARVKPEQIKHIPRVLYHWRAIAGSTATELSAKQYTSQAARKALEEHFSRQNQPVNLSMVIGGHWRAQRLLPTTPPLVTLIIPTRNRSELLIKCVESIQEKTTYPNFEFLIADNESEDPKLLAFYQKMQRQGRFTVLLCPGPFNFSAINNHAVKHSKGEIIGLLNNDLEVMHGDWLDEMVSHALRPEIGAVGAKLYYPDMTIQHAGVITGLGGVAGHAFKHFPRSEPGTPQFRPHLVHNVSAVTAACVVLRKKVFEEAGGFDEINLKIAFNDVDFCLRVQALGYRNLFTPFAELIHHESASRGAEDSPEKILRFQKEIEFMKSRWGQLLLNDPAYNPNLSLDTEDFSFAFPPRFSSLTA